MLSKEFRLNKNIDIERTANRGRSFFARTLGIKYSPNRLQASRFTVVVGLKVHKKSSKRNRPKRQLREILRKHLSEIKKGFDVVIVARKEILDKKFQEIEKDLLYCFQKTQLLK